MIHHINSIHNYCLKINRIFEYRNYKVLHNKLHSETPKNVRRSLETGTLDFTSSKDTDLPTKSKKLARDARSLDKKTNVSKENSLKNFTCDDLKSPSSRHTHLGKLVDIFISKHTSLDHKMRILLKDLTKKRIEYTLRQQEYNDELDRLQKKQEQESIKLLSYELLNDPRYDYDMEEVQNIKQRFSVIQNELSKFIDIISDDSLKFIINIIKASYDEQLKDIVSNAERSLKSIKQIKKSFEVFVMSLYYFLKLIYQI